MILQYAVPWSLSLFLRFLLLFFNETFEGEDIRLLGKITDPSQKASKT